MRHRWSGSEVRIRRVYFVNKVKKMSWIKESKRTWIEKFCINVLQCGAIPKHVAFIMDGNRRFATQNGLEKLQGHALGFERLSETLQWCLDLGITEVTVYTFSIENFKRSEAEVACLMNLAREKFRELLAEKEKLVKHGVCIRLYGDITLLPVDLQMLIAEAILETYNNTKYYLNVCLAYTSREEITAAVKDIATEVVKGKLQECDVTEDLLNKSLYSYKSTNPDVVVRTSGEVRLSDFLLWQGSYSVLSFFKVLWPDFRIWHLFLAVLYYQHFCGKLKAISEEQNFKTQQEESDQEVAAAVQEYESNKTLSEQSNRNFTEEISRIREEMKARRNRFLDHLDRARYEHLIQIKGGNTKQMDPPFKLSCES